MNSSEISPNDVCKLFSLNVFRKTSVVFLVLLNLLFTPTLSLSQTLTVDDFFAGVYTSPNGVLLPYRLYVPPSYDPSKTYPFALFLHGAGERGSDNRLQLTGQTGELAFVNQSLEPIFMLAPQCPSDQQWVNTPFSQGSYSIANTPLSSSLTAVLSLQAALQKQYNIDANRLYATGLSMGGYGVWDLLERYPALYAAGIPMSGGGDPDRAQLIASKPIWDFHGSADGVVPVSGSRDMINAIRASGGSPKYTEYAGADHVIWDTAYSNAELVPWTFANHQVRITEHIVPEPSQTILLASIIFSSILLFRRRKWRRYVVKTNESNSSQLHSSHSIPHSFTLIFFALILFRTASQAQNVRDESAGGGGGSGSRAYSSAAENQGRQDWPIKSKGRPGTAVRLSFDPQNADADFITDRSYTSERLLGTERRLAQTMGFPKTDFVKEAETETSVHYDMEFNKYLSRPRDRVTTFDFDLSRFAEAVQKSDLPKPIVFGIRSDQSHLNQVELLTPQGKHSLRGIVFLRADEVAEGSRLIWKAEVHWSGYVAILFFVCTALLPISLLIRVILNKSSAPVPPSNDATEIQKIYDNSPSNLIFRLGFPVGFILFMLVSNPVRAMESMFFLIPHDYIMIIMGGVIALTLSVAIILPLIQKSKNANQLPLPINPDDPPTWAKTGFIMAMLPMMFLSLILVLLLPRWNPIRSLPMNLRRTSSVWLPISMPIIGLSPAVVVGYLAWKKTRKKLKPGDFWHDRVMNIAQEAKVPVKSVVEVWSSAPNAYASIFGTVGITRGLLNKLEPEEVDAVIAHELGHHVDSHPAKSLIVSLSLTGMLLLTWFWLSWHMSKKFVLSVEAMAILNSPIIIIFVFPMIRAFLKGRGDRKREFAADRFAVKVVGDPEIVIRALTRIHDLNESPHRLKPSDEALASHPSLESRIFAIRKESNARLNNEDFRTDE